MADPQPVPPAKWRDVAFGVRVYQPGGSLARECGDFDAHCQSGYTFFRRDTTPRSTADQYDTAHKYVYVVYEAGKPGTEVDTGTTYGTIRSGRASCPRPGTERAPRWLSRRALY